MAAAPGTGGQQPAIAAPSGAVFISHASQDKDMAAAICTALERAGISCWIAPRDVVPGEFYAESIVRALNDARILVLVLTENAVQSPHVMREVERTSSKRHSIVSLRLDAAALPPAFEYFLSASHWLDASATGIDAALPQLVDAVKQLLASGAGETYKAPYGKSTSTSELAATQPGRGKFPTSLRPMAIASVLLAGLLVYLIAVRPWQPRQVAGNGGLTIESTTPAAALAVSEKSVAVLPFVDMSENRDQEYLSDGLAEELLNLLSRLPNVRVAARTSAFSFKGKSDDVSTIGKKLRVANILEGSVRRSGKSVRVTVELVHVSDGYRLWSQTYDRDFGDILMIQNDIASAVVNALKVKLLGGGPPQSAQADPRAYALLMQGRYVGTKATAASLTQAIELYQQALEIDPSYARAWVGLAQTYSNQINRGMRPVNEGASLAREAAIKALAIDPKFAAAYVELAEIAYVYDGDLRAAAHALEQATELDPANRGIIGVGAEIVRCLGRVKEATALYEYIAASDPESPSAHVNLGMTYLLGRHYDEAAATLRVAQTLSPDFDGLQYAIGMAQLLSGDRAAALATVQLEKVQAWRLIGLTMTYHSLGRKRESDAALSGLIGEFGKDWPFNIAYVMAWRGEADQAFEWLNKAVIAKDSGLAEIVSEPYFESIHADPRWPVFLRKIGRSKEQLDDIKVVVKLPGA